MVELWRTSRTGMVLAVRMRAQSYSCWIDRAMLIGARAIPPGSRALLMVTVPSERSAPKARLVAIGTAKRAPPVAERTLQATLPEATTIDPLVTAASFLPWKLKTPAEFV